MIVRGGGRLSRSKVGGEAKKAVIDRFERVFGREGGVGLEEPAARGGEEDLDTVADRGLHRLGPTNGGVHLGWWWWR